MSEAIKKIRLIVLLLLICEALLVVGPGACARHADYGLRGPERPNPELKAL